MKYPNPEESATCRSSSPSTSEAEALSVMLLLLWEDSRPHLHAEDCGRSGECFHLPNLSLPKSLACANRRGGEGAKKKRKNRV